MICNSVLEARELARKARKGIETGYSVRTCLMILRAYGIDFSLAFTSEEELLNAYSQHMKNCAQKHIVKARQGGDDAGIEVENFWYCFNSTTGINLEDLATSKKELLEIRKRVYIERSEKALLDARRDCELIPWTLETVYECFKRGGLSYSDIGTTPIKLHFLWLYNESDKSMMSSVKDGKDALEKVRQTMSLKDLEALYSCFKRGCFDHSDIGTTPAELHSIYMQGHANEAVKNLASMRSGATEYDFYSHLAKSLKSLPEIGTSISEILALSDKPFN